jgi:hypothetical protein
MEATQSLKIIEQMLKESKRSLHRNSFYFIMWAVLLIPAGVAEWYLFGQQTSWMVWPVMGIIGGIVSGIYGSKEGKRTGVQTAGDRITSFTWGAFIFCLIFSIAYSVANNMSPTPLIMMLAGYATFISGGISKFTPFMWGGAMLEVGAILCGFFVEPEFHGMVFAAGIFIGYLIPGLMLKKSEDGEA